MCAKCARLLERTNMGARANAASEVSVNGSVFTVPAACGLHVVPPPPNLILNMLMFYMTG